MSLVANSAPENTDDVIDSRDVIATIERLEESQEDADTLAVLKALADECEGYGDWQYGETLIRDSYFKDYAQELAEECDMIDHKAKWPMNCIDWDWAVRELKHDYMAVDFGGVTYWMRA
jgi:hypothetical protein